MPANDRQHGGDHYQGFTYKGHNIQPWDVVNIFNLDYFTGVAVVYLLRWRRKGGRQDIEKAIHTLEKLLELDEGEEYASEQRPRNPDDR